MAEGGNVTAGAGAATLPGRDARLDFFRGLAMLIIFVAHTPYNPWARWIPAMFGPSDAAEMFVFCSGFASAIAFGGSFRRHGFGIGCLRVAHRCWQLYWSQVCLVLATAAMLFAATRWLGIRDYLAELNLHPLLNEAGRALVGLLTLTYVPNYFDILPMYIAVLAMMPAALLLARVDVRLVAAASLALWAYAYVSRAGPPAEWWSGRTWFFNPLSWQLLFYTGFAFASGWLRPPPADRRLVWAALLVVLAFVPVSFWGLTGRFPALQAAAEALAWGRDKQHFGPLRYLHFLALAYLGLRAVEAAPGVLAHPLGRLVIKVGQQALPVFLSSIVLAQGVSIMFDVVGFNAVTVAVGNVGGFAVLIGIAHLAAYVKAQPWRGKAAPPPGQVSALRGEVPGAIAASGRGV